MRAAVCRYCICTTNDCECRKPGKVEEVLTLEQVLTPQPNNIKFGHRIVKVEATSINQIDWDTLKGEGYVKEFPLIPCEDLAGTVVAVAPDCERIHFGDKVMGKTNRMVR